MSLIEILRIILLVLLIFCAISVNLTRNLLAAVVIFMSYSSVMCVVWILMESPDLAITEAAVGAGISGVLFLMTLKKIKAVDGGETGLIEDRGEKVIRRKLMGHDGSVRFSLGDQKLSERSSVSIKKGPRVTGRPGNSTSAKGSGSKARMGGGKGRT